MALESDQLDRLDKSDGTPDTTQQVATESLSQWMSMKATTSRLRMRRAGETAIRCILPAVLSLYGWEALGVDSLQSGASLAILAVTPSTLLGHLSANRGLI